MLGGEQLKKWGSYSLFLLGSPGRGFFIDAQMRDCISTSGISWGGSSLPGFPGERQGGGSDAWEKGNLKLYHVNLPFLILVKSFRRCHVSFLLCQLSDKHNMSGDKKMKKMLNNLKINLKIYLKLFWIFYMVPSMEGWILLPVEMQFLNCKLKGGVLVIFKVVSVFNEQSWKAFCNNFCRNVAVGRWRLRKGELWNSAQAFLTGCCACFPPSKFL